MSPEVLAQLYVLRAQLEIAIRLLEGDADTAAAGEDETGCPHPEDKRVDATVMDGRGPRWKCLVCDQEFAGAA